MTSDGPVVDVSEVADPIAELLVWHRDWCQALLDIEAAVERDVVLKDDAHRVDVVPEHMRAEALAAAVLQLMDIDTPEDKAWCRIHAMTSLWLRWCWSAKGIDVLWRPREPF